jgi:hypothetical protein
LPASPLDQRTDLDQQRGGFLAFQIQNSLRHPSPFTLFAGSRSQMDLQSMLPVVSVDLPGAS